MALILQACHHGVLQLTFNDPERRNPINPDTREELIEVLTAAASDDCVRAIMFCGAGAFFSTGGDLKSMPPRSPEESDERMDRLAVLIRLISGSEKPTVAAVEGAAAGASAGIAAVCDYVVMASEAQFLFPFTRLGLIPDAGLLASLGFRVGHARAKRILLLGDPIGAEEAYSIGLADMLSPGPECTEQAIELASELSSRSPLAVSAIKNALSGGPLGLEHALLAERAVQRSLYFSVDFTEGKRAFFDRRAPQFTGH